ncbi:MAG: aminoacyl-histidine dipeptidase, partial [Erysipelotrichaceae bacterium]|nr:aminoacyl-histidine dipeptidase [Erysipelotrichaceae bacterium]
MEFDLNKRHCYWFHELCKIPHGSRNEKALSDFIVDFAKAHGFDYKQDEVWNVIIDKKASEGYENAPGLILQAHMDMV